MKRLTKINYLTLAVLFAITALYSCKKSGTTADNTAANNLTTAITSMQAIQVSGSSLAATTAQSTDAIFVIHAFAPGLTKDSITFSTLPTVIGTYLTVNYAGYTFQKAFKILTATSTVDSYVVIITFNGNPIGLKFSSTGVFVSVLEQCEGHDLGGGPGWHEGGRFGDRDGMQHDTVAISALPSAVKTYFTKNYPTDTLLHAALNMDGSYVIISANRGLYATAVTAAGALITRVQIYPHPNNHTPVLASGLPAVITTYLTTTYPGYLFDKAFVEKTGTTTQGYDVFINVNTTRYAIEFDATGKFVSSIAIR